MKKIYLLFLFCSIAAVSFVSCTKSSTSETSYDKKSYVEVCGLKWATQNVGATKDNPYGSLYTYEQALKACPEDWRLPTGDELKQLSLFHSVPVSFDGMNGMWFSGSIPYKEGVDAVFLSMAGCDWGDGKEEMGALGFYWSSSDGYQNNTIISLRFSGSEQYMDYYDNRSYAHSVRCVK